MNAIENLRRIEDKHDTLALILIGFALLVEPPWLSTVLCFFGIWSLVLSLYAMCVRKGWLK